MPTAAHQRPYEIIAKAEQAWQDSQPEAAERLFLEGVGAYEREERNGTDFALGRFGAFLLAQGRPDEARRVLERAIERRTDIPAIWGDYLRILADRRDVDLFKRTVEQMIGSVRHRIEPEFVLAHARRADREGAASFAQEIAGWVIESSARQGDKKGRWAAMGTLGRILERAGRLDEALKLWRNAFDEGSPDSETVDRLTMHLVRAKDFMGATLVIRQALSRGLPANVEESLRKRLLRCQDNSVGQTSVKSNKGHDVAAFSVRRDSALIRPVFQLRLRSSVNNLGLVGNVARCLLASQQSSTLIDIDLVSGSEMRRIESLPVLTDAVFAADGRGIGLRRTAAVGKGPTHLGFLNAEGHVTSESSVPDATSEVSLGPDLWYVGCRNGFLYAFGLDGRQLWAWETPGARGYTDNVYFRPCPYYVASDQSFAAVASMGNIFAVSPNGKTLWHAVLPNESQTRWEFTIPVPGVQATSKPYDVLGLATGAPLDQVKGAYRRLALATHPDRNPEDNEATARFRRIQEAYERILAGSVESTTPAGITISVEFACAGPTASFLAANPAGVVVGSSQGRLYRFDANGGLREARVLGDGPVRVALRPDGTIGAAWCSNALVFFRENNVINAAEAVGWPSELTMFGDAVVLWNRSEVHLMDAQGRLLWAVEFSKSVRGVATHDNMLVCAAGVLAAFQRLPD